MQSLLEAEPILNVTSPDSGLGPLIDYKQNNSFGLHTCLHNTSPFQTLVQKVTVYDYHSYKKSPIPQPISSAAMGMSPHF